LFILRGPLSAHVELEALDYKARLLSGSAWLPRPTKTTAAQHSYNNTSLSQLPQHIAG
jgi:hypothetical protein